jgi:hypothetical protein
MTVHLYRCSVCSQLFAAPDDTLKVWTATHIGCPAVLTMLVTGARGLFGLTDIKAVNWPELSPVEIDPTVSKIGDGWTIDIELKEGK